MACIRGLSFEQQNNSLPRLDRTMDATLDLYITLRLALAAQFKQDPWPFCQIIEDPFNKRNIEEIPIGYVPDFSLHKTVLTLYRVALLAKFQIIALLHIPC